MICRTHFGSRGHSSARRHSFDLPDTPFVSWTFFILWKLLCSRLHSFDLVVTPLIWRTLLSPRGHPFETADFPLVLRTLFSSRRHFYFIYSPPRPRILILVLIQYYSVICRPSDHTVGRPWAEIRTWTICAGLGIRSFDFRANCLFFVQK